MIKSTVEDRHTTALAFSPRAGALDTIGIPPHLCRNAPAAGAAAQQDSEAVPPYRSGVVASAGLLLFLSFGSAYSVPVLFPILSETLNIPAWHFAALFSVTGALYFMLGLVSGPLAERIGADTVAAAGQATLGIGLFLASLAQSELALGIACFLGIGIGVGLCFVPVVGAVQSLCRKNPALAGGIAASGIGAGTLALPVLTHIIADDLGWRAALQMLSVLALCGIYPTRWLIPEGYDSSRRILRPAVAHAQGGSRRSGSFWSLYAAQLLISLAAFVPFAHLGLFATAAGWSAGTGVYLISLIGVGSLGGRALIGVVAEQLGSCRTASLCAMIMACSFLGLILVSQRWELGCVTMLYGIGYGGANGLLGPIVGEVLGVQDIFRSVGSIATSRALGVLVGPWAVGIIECRTGCYSVSFLICAALVGIAAGILSALHRKANSRY
jgi:MFS family permease